MAVTAHATGTLTSTAGGTEDFLTSPAVAGTFQLSVDLNAMLAGDIVQLRVYRIVLTGGTTRVCYFESFSDVQPADAKIADSIPISNELTDANSLRFSLTQTAGSARSFPWKVLKFS